MMRTEHNPPFTRHLDVLRDKIAYLTQRIEEEPDAPGRPFWSDERKALRWAIAIVEGELAQERDPGEIARYMSQRARVRSELDREFQLFLQFLEFIDWHKADEKVKTLKWDW